MKKNNLWQYLTDMAPYVLLAIVSMALFLLFTQLKLINNPDRVQPIMIAALVGALVVFVMFSLIKGWNWRYGILLLLCMGIIMRLGYTLYTYYLVRGHDTGSLQSQDYGHVYYLWQVFYHHSLPETYLNQGYQPPFYYLVSSLAIYIDRAFFPNSEPAAWIDASKMVSCIVSCYTLLLIRKLCREFSLKESATALVLGITAFVPNLLLMAGRVNNDAMVTFFIVLITLYTIKWYKNQSWGNTVVLALAFGLGMMSKLSCGLMALFTGPVLLLVWIKNRKTPAFWSILRKGIVFACICFPLGLWYPIRSSLLYHIPLNYVPSPSVDGPLYISGYSLVQRFLHFSLTDLLKTPFCSPTEDYSVPMYIVRCSLFGEFCYNVPHWLTSVFLCVNILLILLSLCSMIYVCAFGEKGQPLLRFGMPFLWLIQFGSYLIFQITYPFGCTMDYRYIPITCIIGAILIACGLHPFRSRHPRAAIPVTIPVVALVSLYGLCSIFMYCQI